MLKHNVIVTSAKTFTKSPMQIAPNIFLLRENLPLLCFTAKHIYIIQCQVLICFVKIKYVTRDLYTPAHYRNIRSDSLKFLNKTEKCFWAIYRENVYVV